VSSGTQSLRPSPLHQSHHAEFRTTAQKLPGRNSGVFPRERLLSCFRTLFLGVVDLIIERLQDGFLELRAGRVALNYEVSCKVGEAGGPTTSISPPAVTNAAMGCMY
jgi:hypothetical protein